MSVSDRARDFWDRISPRERLLVAVGAFALPLTIALWLGLSIRDGLIAMEDRNDKTRRALVIVEDLKARGPAQVVDDAVAAIPPDPIGLETYVSNAAKKGSLTFKGPIDRRPSVTRNGFMTTSVSCSLDDVTTEQLKGFLQEVETSKVVAVTHIDLRRDFRDKKKLDVTFEVTTYSRPAQPSGEGSGSSAGSGEKKGG
ncbi:MAG: hypothetical protein H6Q90_1038 [Deltaproteobacteria bacterium]|nr:hypothetical protein [Deltaproteobacteria bacterium]